MNLRFLVLQVHIVRRRHHSDRVSSKDIILDRNHHLLLHRVYRQDILLITTCKVCFRIELCLEFFLSSLNFLSKVQSEIF